MTEHSRSANQIREEPIPPTPAHDDTPATDTHQPDAATDDAVPAESQDRPQAGVPERTVTDVAPAPGTSETLSPVEGTYRPDVDPEERPLPGRPTESR